ncbi:MAG TPA: DUF1206 domain-containing protein [Gaiellaceae bacterium]|nr:DUF1206 domain-containing protein [Gaiellaceae bacterium]
MSSSLSRDASRAGNDFVHTPVFAVLSRAGFVARGLVYGIIGLLALRLAVGAGGTITNQEGALHAVARQDFGQFLLTLVAIGLGGYSVWRLMRAAIGHGPEGRDSGVERVGALGSGIFYGTICIAAVKILAGADAGSEGNAKKTTAGVYGWPAGAWIIGAAGVVMIGVALYQGHRGVTRSFLADSKTEEMGPEMKRWITRIGVVGHLARMVVFALVGIFLIKAAIDAKPDAAIGLDGALAKVLHRSYGSLLLGVVSAGLIAFALFSLSEARYRRI